MSFFPFSIYFGSYPDKDKYVYFQRTLIRTYIEEEVTSVVAEYFSIENLGSVNKLGGSQIQLLEKFRCPQLVSFTVTSNTELAILAPYLLLCDSTKSEFCLWQLGDYEKIWNISLSKDMILDASFCGVVMMDGPMIAFVYQNASMSSEETFEENNTYIVLWRPLLQKNALCTLSLLAYNIQGFWLPHQQEYDIVNDNDEPYRFISIVYRPLYKSCITTRNFFENYSSPIPFFISMIPDYYTRNITCLLRTNHVWNNEEIIWIGTSQGNILCIKNADEIGDVKPIWCTDVTHIPLKMEEVQLDKRVGGIESILIIRLENGLIILNSENGKKLRELSNEIILLFGDFYQCGYQSIIQVPCRLNGRLISFNEILIDSINEENVDSSLEGNVPHLSSLLDSLSTRIYDGTAQIRKIEEMISQKYNLLNHSDILLQTFSYLIGSYYLKRVKLTKQVLRHSKHTEGFISLIPGTRILTKDLSIKIYTSQADEQSCIEIMEARTSIGKFNHDENILIEILVRNKSFQDLYAVHLVIYFKSTSGLISSMLKSNSSYINLLRIGETRTIFSLIYMPLDLVSNYLEFGAFILYCKINEIYSSNLYRLYDEMIWETLCVTKIKKTRIMSQNFGRVLPSMTYLIFTTINSMSQKWNISLLPFLLEQYLGVISKEDSENGFSKDYRHLDVSLPLPLFTSTQALDSLNDVLYILEHLITAKLVNPNVEVEERKSETINGLSEKLRQGTMNLLDLSIYSQRKEESKIRGYVEILINTKLHWLELTFLTKRRAIKKNRLPKHVGWIF
ncbi:hypothetical protein C1645_816913 [Glomus cerebriforme]|uniref:Uncharacterized protein n=1 Tax=Glomus cerebriforme TaxID=658196 RepID=A0A397TAK5_9GLOM|nr:hypothetical protein C1645_816913 [Glomus cerebriforme]